ncbi:Homocysteine S-methyltransferase OS=Ureibacillus acetophenoni OX=614649 GN=SAMN05877842_11627 PE=4 SV=1 [Ureibacillus acetophenoni]
MKRLNRGRPRADRTRCRANIAAGADIIQTNTYGANAIKLARYGLESKVVEINEAAIRLAKNAAKPGGQFVVGSIGGIRGVRKNDTTLEEILSSVKEQAEGFN